MPSKSRDQEEKSEGEDKHEGAELRGCGTNTDGPAGKREENTP